MFTLFREEARLSVFFIPTWWRAVREVVACSRCAQLMDARAADYLAVEASPSLDVRALVERTNPGLAERLKREGAVSAGRKLISDAEQTAFIADAVRDASRAVGRASWWGAPLFWLAALVLSELWLMQDLKPPMPLAMMVVTVVALVWCRRMVIRFLRREVLQSLAETLTPLQPTRHEIIRAAKTTRRAEREVLKYGGLSQVLSLMARASVASPVGLIEK
ncbi:hypothetical protein [Pyxidicoccus caerfyrddinensis]|uniref:hypothetical protein n=1 Tax=Pyxidicoccus caerfyrddinensis TaxID=2709663 RepID=UPI0013DA4169|nr:hypothetical protein [Pyxidicoccus caerfyrddinensis]